MTKDSFMPLHCNTANYCFLDWENKPLYFFSLKWEHWLLAALNIFSTY